MSDEIFFDGVRYVSAHDAASSSNLSRDYVARLCREGVVRGRRIGTHWYVDQSSFQSFFVEQQYAKSHRKESLVEERVHEYHGQPAPLPPRSAAPLAIARAETPPPEMNAIIRTRGSDVRTRLQDAFAKHSGRTLGSAARLAGAPAGFAHATLATLPAQAGTHVPLHALSPLTEFLHKLVALTLTMLLTLGTYALVDPQYARFAANSISDQFGAIAKTYRVATDGGIGVVTYRAEVQLAAAAENPGGVFSFLQSALTNGVSQLARATNARVNALVYGIAFPQELVRSLGVVPRASVAVSVSSRPPSRQNQTPTSRALASAPQTIPNTTPPIVDGDRAEAERVIETQRILAVGGISEEILNARLQELDRELTARILGISASAPAFSGPSYTTPATTQIIAQSSRIDHLGNVIIDGNSSWSGGTITAASITNSSVSATTLSASGGTSLATTTITGDLTVNGAVSIGTTSSSGLTTTYLTATNATTTNATSTNLTVFTTVVAPSFNATSTTATSTFAGGILGTRVPTLPHTFSSWTTGAANANALNAALVINPASATADSNLLSASVNNSVKFLVDAEGDVFVNNLTSVGSVTLSTTSASTFTVEGNTTLGDSITDTTTVNGTLTVAGTTTVASVAGKFGVGTTSPLAKLSVHANNGETNEALFIVASSTGSATTTLFKITNTGAITSVGVITSTAGSANTFPYASSTALTVSGTGYFDTASTTNLTISGLPSVLLSTNGSGAAQAATIGSSLSFSSNTLSLNTANANTWTGLQQFSNASTTLFSAYGPAYFGATATSSFSTAGILTLAGSLNGPLDARNGIVGATTSIGALYGGTGQSSVVTGDLLYGSATNVWSRLGLGTGGFVLGVSGGLPAWVATTTLSNISGTLAVGKGGTGVTTFGGTNTLLYTTSADALTSSSNLTFDGTKFAIASSSPWAQLSVNPNGITGPAFSVGSSTATNFVVGNNGNVGVGTTTPGTLFSINNSANFVASATSTILNGLNTPYLNVTGTSASSTFANGLVLSGGTLNLSNGGTGVAQFSSGVLSASSTVAAVYGGTGQSSVVTGDLLYGSATNVWSRLGLGTGGFVLGVSGGLPAWVATSTLSTITGTLAVAKGGTGQTTFGGTNTLLYTSSADTLTSLATANTSALVTNTSGAPAWTSGGVANRVLRTDGQTISFGQVALATDVAGTLPIANGGTATTTFYSGGVVFSDGSKLTQAAAAANFFWDNSNNRLGLGTSTPWAALSVNPNGIGAGPEFAIGSSTLTHFIVDNSGRGGFGTTTPWGRLAVDTSNLAAAIPSFVVGSSTRTDLIITQAGNTGLGTTSPYSKLSVANTVSGAQFSLAYDTSRYADLKVDSTGDLHIEPQGQDIFLNNDNFWVCTGGSITTGGCPSGSPSGVGNLIVENRVGVGTTTLGTSNANYKLTIETQDSTSNFFNIASSTSNWSATKNLFTIGANGYVGIATSSPFAKLSVGPGGAILTTENALVDGVTITINWLDGNQQRVTLGGNRTIAFSNYTDGQILRLVLCQDATGSRTLTWPAVVLWSGGTAPTLTTTASKCDIATFVATQATGTLKVFGSSVLAF